MTEIRVSASRDYSVLIGAGLLERCGELAAPLIKGRRAVVCAGENVFPLYGETVLRSLRAAGVGLTRKRSSYMPPMIFF